MINMKAWAARLLLKLPERWTTRLAGGPIEIAGRTLDPPCRLIAFLASRDETFEGVSTEEARQTLRNALALVPFPETTGVRVEDTSFKRGDVQIPVRIYQPIEQNPSASVLVYFHAGGGVMGDLEMCHSFCGLLSVLSKRPVISVAYRLAPENAWPVGLEDAIAAYEWALAHAERLDAPEGRAAVGGDSMGANYAAVICQEMKNKGAPSPDFQLLIYPSLDFAQETPAMETYRGVYPMTEEATDFILSNLLRTVDDREDPRISPLCQTELSDLPEAIVYSAGFDPLQDQARLYHQRLLDAGNSSTYRCYETMPHGFVSFMGISENARKACVEIAASLALKTV